MVTGEGERRRRLVGDEAQSVFEFVSFMSLTCRDFRNKVFHRFNNAERKREITKSRRIPACDLRRSFTLFSKLLLQDTLVLLQR